MRPEIKIPTNPKAPYPIRYDAEIIRGFGRGSSELGIPTANIPVGNLNILETGIYFGWCKLDKNENFDVDRDDGKKTVINNGSNLRKEDLKVLPMVMSIGWNPFYENKQKAAEVHILHEFDRTFYGASIKIVILGYIRPELNYTSKEALIGDIKKDIEIAEAALLSVPYESYRCELDN